MGKWFGKIGYAETIESKPGVWTEKITEREYYGDMTRNSHRLHTVSTLNDNIVISNELSILADPFAYQNSTSIRYATFMDTKWKVSNVEVQYPRLILTLGEVYNG